MKYVFILLFMFSSLAIAQAPETPEPMADVVGAYVQPTPAQKARVHAAAQKAKKKKLKAKAAKKITK